MTVQIITSLRPQVASAHRIIQTLIIRSQAGAVYTIGVGESLFDEALNPFEAKVTLKGSTDDQIGVCEGTSVIEVIEAAQQLIAKSIQDGIPQSAIPKPHMLERPSVQETSPTTGSGQDER